MAHIIYALYGFISYALGLASLVAFMLFANNLFGVALGENYASLNIDHYNGPAKPYPVFWNSMLLLVFGLQHSIMARPWFKHLLTRLMPERLERSTYILATAVALLLIVQFWQPVASHTFWTVNDPTARLAINGLYLLGYGITVAATYMLSHNHLFGLTQSMGSGDTDKTFRTPLFYKYMRHPIQTGILIAMLATPDMTYGRAVLAAGMIVYIFIGLYFEEKNLIEEFGDTYRDYKKRVPALLPFLKVGRF